MPKRPGDYTVGYPNKNRYPVNARNLLIAAGREFGPRLVKIAAQKLKDMAVKKSQASQTKRKAPANRKRRYMQSPQNGESAGFFSKKAKKDMWAPYTKNGIVCTREVGCLLTGLTPTRPIFAGHSTHSNTFDMLYLISRTIVRDIFNKGGVSMTNMDTESPGSYTLFIRYTKGDANAVPTTFSVTTSSKTYAQIGNDVRNFINTQIADNTVFSLEGQFYFNITDVWLESSVGTYFAKRDYRNTYVHILSKSDLKIQNRTVATGIDEDVNSSENVANQPLFGKAYYGKGNGMICRADSSTATQSKSLICGSEASNLLAFAPGSLDYWLEEPPLPTLFSPIPKQSKASIEPGKVKTSQLVAVYKCKLSDYFRNTAQFTPTASGGGVKSGRLQNRYGKFAIFALEKMLCVTSTDSNPVVGLEVNCRLGVMFKHSTNRNIAESTFTQTFVTQANGQS